MAKSKPQLLLQKEEITPESLDKVDKRLTQHTQQINLMKFIVYAVVIVLAVGFITVVITAGGLLQQTLATRSASYQDLVDQVNESNIKIDLLFNKIDKIK